MQVRERQETVRDSRTGKESVTVTRNVGDRVRTTSTCALPAGMSEHMPQEGWIAAVMHCSRTRERLPSAQHPITSG